MQASGFGKGTRQHCCLWGVPHSQSAREGYSPDLNPIKQVFDKLKTLLRKAAARTEPRVLEAIAEILDTFTQAECAYYLRHAGYASR
jgi:transposase